MEGGQEERCTALSGIAVGEVPEAQLPRAKPIVPTEIGHGGLGSLDGLKGPACRLDRTSIWKNVLQDFYLS